MGKSFLVKHGCPEFAIKEWLPRPSPPDPISLTGFRGYEMVVWSVAMSIAFLMMLVVYPVLKYVVPYDTTFRMMFPTTQSFWYVAFCYVNDYTQDKVVQAYVYRISHY